MRNVVLATLVYVKRASAAHPEGEILMIHRNGRPGDYHSGKWNGLGGKLEIDESPLQGAMRELREESGLELPEGAFRSLGVVQFPNFKAHKNEDWICFVFTADAGEQANAKLVAGEEGELHWVPAQEVLSLNLWAGDKHFVPYVAGGRPFIGTIWYRGEEVLKHWIQAL